MFIYNFSWKIATLYDKFKVMSYLFKKILVGLARVQIRRYKPMIIGVTGNAGKTSVKEAIAAVLRRGKTVR
ncbi:MAG: hypothetical protein V1821_02730, partial [bacterium]